MYKAKYLSPMIPSHNIEKTVSFFKNSLDFKIGRDAETIKLTSFYIKTT